MAENVSTKELKKDELSGGFNWTQVWTIIVLHWPWIVLSTFIALCLAFCYLRYATPVYTTSMKMLIKDDDGRKRSMGGNQMTLQDLGFVTNSAGFDNELEILSSISISGRIVKNLKLYVNYAIEGKLRTTEQYHNNPIIVDMPPHQLEVLNAVISLEMTKKGEGLHIKGTVKSDNVKAPTRREPIEFERDIKKLPGSINTPLGVVLFQQNPGAKWEDETLYATILPLKAAALAYRDKLKVQASSKTTTVASVTFTDTQVDRAIDYLNELLNSYNADAEEDKNEVARKTEQFINTRIDLIRGDLDVTEGELEQYKKNNELINLANDATAALTSSTEYQKKQVEFETQLNLINALVSYMSNPANAMQVIPANLGLNDLNLNATIAKYNETVLQRNRLLKTSSEDNPLIQRLTNQLEEMWPSIRMSLDAIRSDVKTQKTSADQQYAMFNNRITNKPTQERALTNMSRQQEIKSSLYLMLLQKREENSISLASTATKARIIDAPQFVSQVSPKGKIVWLLALIVGAGLPVGLVYLLGLLRFRIEGREDVEKLTNISILSDIPLSASHQGENVLAVRENTNDSMEEAFRGLRTNLRFVMQGDEKVILCTSCIPSEGKTFVSTNLAMSIALMGKKVIVVGLDIRNPRLVKLFNLKSDKKGISTFLSGSDTSYAVLEEQITHGVGHANLDVLPAGIIPPNPGEIITRKQLDCAVNLLKEHYDYVLLDTPPVGLVSDTLSIARVADVSLVVCRADYSPKANFDLINSLRDDSKLPKVNLVLNAVDMRKKKYGYYYGYGKYGKYGSYGRYGHYGVYGQYGNAGEKEHVEK